MKRLFILLPFLINIAFAQVYATDPTFCFLPSTKALGRNLSTNDNHLIPQSFNLNSQTGSPINFKDIELSISGDGVLKDYVITWSKDGGGTIEAKFKDSNCYSISSDFSIWDFHRLFLNDIPTKKRIALLSM